MKYAFFYDTKIGKIKIIENDGAITDLCWDKTVVPKDICIKETELLKQAGNQLLDYFSGKLKTFDLPLAPKGTEFQQKVWKALQAVPYGETRSYKQIAEETGNSKACRAVGMANNRNPIPIFIPCHRIIGSNGKMVGYGGGLDIKEYLLNLEKANLE